MLASWRDRSNCVYGSVEGREGRGRERKRLRAPSWLLHLRLSALTVTSRCSHLMATHQTKPSWIAKFRVHTPCNALHRLHAARFYPVLLLFPASPALPCPPLPPSPVSLPSLPVSAVACHSFCPHHPLISQPRTELHRNQLAPAEEKRHIHHTLQMVPHPPTLLSPTILRQFRH